MHVDREASRCFHKRMRRLNRTGLVLAAAIAALSWGCGASSSTAESGNGGAAGSASSGGNNAGGNGGNSGGDGGGIGGFGGAGNGGNNQGGSGGMACAGSTVKGELVPLDMYIMLDKSGSMSELTGASGNGPSKWDAVTTALQAFFKDMGSEGLGVGLQFFPLKDPSVPDTCTNSNQCGAAAPCLLKTCDDQPNIAPCDTTNDCSVFGTCVPLGQCSANKDFYCYYDPMTPAACGVDPQGNDLGTCQQLTESFCLNQDSCAAGDYSDPAVEIATLNGAEQGLKDAIAANVPGGSTPTAPALDGAIKHAQSWAGAHPDHKVVAVLATDGLPTECDPLDIGSIADLAANGKNGTPSVPTFVIGVFGQNDAGAQQNLDQIAQKGGTTKAFFITANQDVTTAFLDALHAIQGKTLACEYQIPLPSDGSEPDYTKVNVEYIPQGENTPQTVFYVGKASACDATDGGWYYDKDPAGGATPTKILMCPATCTKLKSVGGQVDIKIGCQTIVPEPK
jgi:hypothetical protein